MDNQPSRHTNLPMEMLRAGKRTSTDYVKQSSMIYLISWQPCSSAHEHRRNVKLLFSESISIPDVSQIIIDYLAYRLELWSSDDRNYYCTYADCQNEELLPESLVLAERADTIEEENGVGGQKKSTCASTKSVCRYCTQPSTDCVCQGAMTCKMCQECKCICRRVVYKN